jgi:hypothetical protein
VIRFILFSSEKVAQPAEVALHQYVSSCESRATSARLRYSRRRFSSFQGVAATTRTTGKLSSESGLSLASLSATRIKLARPINQLTNTPEVSENATSSPIVPALITRIVIRFQVRVYATGEY